MQEIEKLAAREDFWGDAEKAKELLKEKTRLENSVHSWTERMKELEELEELHQLALEENDRQALEEVDRDVGRLRDTVRNEELKALLSGEDDARNAILSIHAGAGGTEAQDWAEMLLRMYLRWAERRVSRQTSSIINPVKRQG
jgi:peptide chain release factor 2